jgi:hypothetical protein
MFVPARDSIQLVSRRRRLWPEGWDKRCSKIIALHNLYNNSLLASSLQSFPSAILKSKDLVGKASVEETQIFQTLQLSIDLYYLRAR